jgi:hypothetical protein
VRRTFNALHREAFTRSASTRAHCLNVISLLILLTFKEPQGASHGEH